MDVSSIGTWTSRASREVRLVAEGAGHGQQALCHFSARVCAPCPETDSGGDAEITYVWPRPTSLPFHEGLAQGEGEGARVLRLLVF